MPDRPFHHGNLRAVLLEQAETVLREKGLGALSLRDLAREAGVSHGAPRSHFIDRGALLDALAERGFTRLADEVRAAVAAADGGAPEHVLRVAGSAFVRFGVREPALHDLMFATKAGSPSAAVQQAAARLFETMTGVMSVGVDAGAYAAGDVDRLTVLMAATMHGITAFAASGRIPPGAADGLVADAVSLLLRGPRPEA